MYCRYLLLLLKSMSWKPKRLLTHSLCCWICLWGAKTLWDRKKKKRKKEKASSSVFIHLALTHVSAQLSQRSLSSFCWRRFKGWEESESRIERGREGRREGGREGGCRLRDVKEETDKQKFGKSWLLTPWGRRVRRTDRSASGLTLTLYIS